VPLTDITRLVSRIGKVMRQSPAVVGQGNSVFITTGRRSIKASLQTRARRAAYRLTGKGMGCVCVLLRKSVQIGRQPHRIAVQTCGIPALLVGEKNYNIGFFIGFCHLRNFLYRFIFM
jgi:hypothetical protein